MKLKELLHGLKYELQGESRDIRGLSYDSRKIQAGDLFVAIKGFKADGHDFVQEAVLNGATAVVLEHSVKGAAFTQVIVPDTRRALAVISSNFYGNPGSKLRLWGVTGTNGKTTSCYLLKSILESAGYRVGLIGTIEILLGDSALETERTTPESLELQKILAKMVSADLDYVVMEVSSHALELQRTYGLPFEAGLFTNLSPEHLDFHENIHQYFLAKTKLFQSVTGTAVLNADDPWFAPLKASVSCPLVTYGIKHQAQFGAKKIKLEKSGVSYILKSEVGQIPINLKLAGSFNVSNSLGAAALAFSQGISLACIQKGLANLPGVPGRFETVENEKGLAVIVDFAHTPDGLKNILETAKMMAKERLIVVFGAGGDRDKEKRPQMGKIAARLADYVIITSDNPRSEDPLAICSAIEAGFLQVRPRGDHKIIIDRREAIRNAIASATRNDLVLIAGKGHETYQEFADARIPFDDRQEARAAIKELKDQ
ncbi:MAG: UDP-N-acetylmuramoyl-L-alanyl-D-glutamate--2,6-diaminopimelate ligase [Firmicutes bacterium]|nr:UDP-N-acetylmuramoyl-L-alanyl-D-glutamate--2,6-diaminopimelate ligase [Bacillota bacterium]